MVRLLLVLSAQTGPASAAAEREPEGGAALALLLLIALIVSWIGLRSAVRKLRARRTEKHVGGDFTEYALESLVNAAKLDGRVNDQERRAVAAAMRDVAGVGFDAARVDSAFERARLTKDELVAYLAAKHEAFSHEQKTSLLKALLSVFVADGRFDAAEHAALVDYTEAIGFDRQKATETLRRLSGDMVRGNIT